MTAARAMRWWTADPGRVTFADLGAALTLIAVVTAFTGAAFWKLSLGPVHLFAYRIVLVGLWLYLLAGVLYVGAPLLPARVHRVRWALAFLVAWLAYSLVNTSFVMSTAEYIVHVGFIAMGVSLVFFGAVFVGRAGPIHWAYRLWLLVLAALIAMGVAQYLLGFQLPISQFAGASDERRFMPMGTFPRVNQYAAFLALSAAFPLALLTTRAAWPAMLAAGGLLAGIIGLLMVLTAQAALLGVAVQLVVALYLVSRHRGRTLLRLTGLAIVAALTIGGVIVYGFGGVGQMLERLQSGTGSLGVRFNLTLNGLFFARDSAGLGIGAGNFNAWIEATDYRPTNYRAGGTVEQITYPHNWWIELLAEYGLIITAAFVAFFVGVVAAVARAYRRAVEPLPRRLGEALLMGLAGYPVVALAPGHFAAFRPQWVLLAMAIAYVVAARSDEAPASAA